MLCSMQDSSLIFILIHTVAYNMGLKMMNQPLVEEDGGNPY